MLCNCPLKAHSLACPGSAVVVQVVANLRRQRDEVREKHRRLLQAHHERFHKVWGQLMKTGYQNSRFAHQVWMRCTGMMRCIGTYCKAAMRPRGGRG